MFSKILKVLLALILIFSSMPLYSVKALEDTEEGKEEVLETELSSNEDEIKNEESDLATPLSNEEAQNEEILLLERNMVLTQ